MYSIKEKRFIRFNLITIISLFLLILAGGVVRSSGSGMGCPDWPKCFDHYIPPTDVSQLPVAYQQKYLQKRLDKNEKFAKLLDKMGYQDLAVKVRHDESIKVPEVFNVTKTYTEYINRLIGAITGLLLLLCFVFSFTYVKKHIKLTVLSFLNLILVVFQAWLGSIVVSTNLLAWTITVHMLVAILIIAIVIYTYHYAKAIGDVKNYVSSQKDWFVRLMVFLAILVSTIQIIIGTEVRESIDALLQRNPTLLRSNWISNLGHIYDIHKNIAIAVIAINLVIYFIIKNKIENKKVYNFSKVLLVLLALQFITGTILNFLGMPPFSQAFHVLFAVMFFSAQFYLLLMLKPALRFL